MTTTTPLVQVEGLTKLFPVASSLFRRPKGYIHAVEDVSFDLFEGQSLGLVGESGCGKTTIGKLLVKLQEPTSGRILFRESNRYSSDTNNVAEFADLSQTKGRQLKEF